MLILGKIIIRQNFRILASKIIKINERNYLFANNIRFYLLNYEKLNVYKLATSIQSRGVRKFFDPMYSRIYLSIEVLYISRRFRIKSIIVHVWAEFSKFIIASSLEKFKKERKKKKKKRIFFTRDRVIYERIINVYTDGISFFFSSLLDTNVISKSFFMHYRWLDDRLSFQRARLCFKSFRWREETKPGPLESVRADLLKRARL